MVVACEHPVECGGLVDHADVAEVVMTGHPLTPHQIRILQRFADGLGTADIAREFCGRCRDCEIAHQQIRRSLGKSRILDCVVLGFRGGWLR